MPRGPTGTAATTVPHDRMGKTPDQTAGHGADRVVAHRKTSSGIQYKVLRHGYTAADDTWVRVEGLSQAFIDCYWRVLAASRRKYNPYGTLYHPRATRGSPVASCGPSPAPQERVTGAAGLLYATPPSRLTHPRGSPSGVASVVNPLSETL